MNLIEKTRKEIEVLQAKLSFLEELENTKTDVEEAFKTAYGYYHDDLRHSWNADIEVWEAFQKGYQAGLESIGGNSDFPAEAPKHRFETTMDDAPEKPGAIYNICREWWMNLDNIFDMDTCIEDLTERIESSFPDYFTGKGHDEWANAWISGFNEYRRLLTNRC